MSVRFILIASLLGVGLIIGTAAASSPQSIDAIAAQGDAEAETKLGFAYQIGKGKPLDHKLAAYWFQKAAYQGYAAAEFHLSLSYFSGDGLPVDPAKGMYWCRKAADKNYGPAQRYVGILYEFGTSVAKDANKSIYWLMKSVDHASVNEYISDVPIDYRSSAAFDIGRMYYMGDGISFDYLNAAYWFQRSVYFNKLKKQFAAEAMIAEFYLGEMYESGKGVIKDETAAAIWYKQSAESGFGAAQFNLGLSYMNGRGLPRDLISAYAWLTVAKKSMESNTDYYIAITNVLNEIETGMTSGDVDRARALATGWQAAYEHSLMPAAMANAEP